MAPRGGRIGWPSRYGKSLTIALMDRRGRDCPFSRHPAGGTQAQNFGGAGGRSSSDWVRKGPTPTQIPTRMPDEPKTMTLRGGEGPEFVALGTTSRGGAVFRGGGGLPMRVVLRSIGRYRVDAVSSNTSATRPLRWLHPMRQTR